MPGSRTFDPLKTWAKAQKSMVLKKHEPRSVVLEVSISCTHSKKKKKKLRAWTTFGLDPPTKRYVGNLPRDSVHRTWLAPHSYHSFHLMHHISPMAKMRTRFMILCQPSLNGLPFIFSPPLLYKPPFSFIPRHRKNPLSSPLLSSNEVE